MAFALAHRELSSFTCEDCKKWIIDIKTGKRSTRGGKPQRRAPGQRAPCRTCPRQSPERAKALELGPRETATANFYFHVRATHGACMNERERADPLLLRNLAIVDQVIRRHEADKSVADFASLFPRKG